MRTLVLLAVLLSACNCSPPGPKISGDAPTSKLDPAKAPPQLGPRRLPNRAGRLCAQLECNAQQEEKLAELFEKPAPVKRRREIATAFRAQTLTPADLAKPGEAQSAETAAATLSELHAMLNPGQRERFAKHVTKRGLGFLHGAPRGGPGKAPRDRGSAAFCEAIDCNGDQQAAIDQAFASAGSLRPQRGATKADRSALAETFRGEAPDIAAIIEFLEASRARRHDRESRNVAAILTIHRVLSPKQRETVATLIEQRGLGATVMLPSAP